MKRGRVYEFNLDLTSQRFWSSRANDVNLCDEARCQAVYQLFHRFATPCMTLNQLAQVLASPNWLTPNMIELMEFAGKLPVQFQRNDDVYWLAVFPNVIRNEMDVYLRVEGRHDPQKVRHLLCSNMAMNLSVSDARILEIGWGVFQGRDWVLRARLGSLDDLPENQRWYLW